MTIIASHRASGGISRAGRPRGDVLATMMGLTVCLLPFLVPAGPGNTALADVGMTLCIGLALLWSVREHLPVKVPYLLGVAGLVLGGAFAAYIAQAPVGVGLVLAQDLLLLAWGAALALGRHNPAIVSAVTRAWCRTAPVYSGVMAAAYLLGINALSGVSAKDGVRASYTFGDPNLAGNYLVVSLFVMAACKCPRSPGVRRIAYILVVTAIGFTGSNGAMLTLLVGLVLTVAVTRYRRSGPVAGLSTLAVSMLLAGLVFTFVMPRVDLGQVREAAAGSVPLLRDSFGRSASSTSERATIVHEGTRLYFQGDVTGYGPARTKATLAANQAPYVKEAHNDYLATLLERGLIGALGLLALGLAIGVRCFRLVIGTLPDAYAALVPRPWLLAVIGPVMATAAGFYEVLHFRHLWTWLGLVAALVLVLQDQQKKRVS
ncbi:O-antigen ligase-like membrane protein [Kribbella voronezhensis]|uniref:O-antigen ligase-like membrane protein n=1 Tax=Kribbella voronezhensis TaxID=2512212 RepID=A0A4V3FIV9_9ACTN|nr:O-antigen ligase family protein [Kribbella voronezhensis]TDU83933.1 O-antigen ligase-like membrane protein [Kribbella voronezhensis]